MIYGEYRAADRSVVIPTRGIEGGTNYIKLADDTEAPYTLYKVEGSLIQRCIVQNGRYIIPMHLLRPSGAER